MTVRCAVCRGSDEPEQSGKTDYLCIDCEAALL
jgi:hypothetical protein